LLDTIGELRKAYCLADVVVIGRSFGDLFGSDPMEAAALGKPVVIGPRVEDFASIVATMKREKAIVQTTREELSTVLHGLFDDAGERAEMGRRAQACVCANQGAAERHAAIINQLITKRASQ